MILRHAALVTTALALAGCPAEELTGGRYACLIDAGADQCPGDWRCGFEGVCHPIGDRRPWICVGDEHCEGGWVCGLTASRDGGECHDPMAAAPHACNTSAHCTGGWHCGPALTCYDRTVPAAVSCRTDAGDCADGWRCGLDARCQDTTAGAPYLCAEADGGLNDAWCEQQWRCAPEGRCTDPALDALGNAPPKAFAPAAVIHPVHPGPAFVAFSLSPTYPSGIGSNYQTLAFAADGGLFADLIDLRNGQRTRFGLGPWEGGRFLAFGSRGIAPNGAIEENARVFHAFPDGGSRLFELDPGGTLYDTDEAFIFPATELVMGTTTPALSPRALSYTPDDPTKFNLLPGAWFHTSFHDFQTDFPSAPWNFAGNRIVDVATVHPVTSMDCVFAVDQRGLWSAQKGTVQGLAASSDFEAVEVATLTNDFCGPRPASSQRISGLASHGRDWLATASALSDGGSPSVTLLDLRPLWTQSDVFTFCTTVAGGPCAPATRIPIGVRTGPCPVCGAGAIADFSLVGDPASPRIDVRCATADGGTAGFVSISSEPNGTGCRARFPESRSGLLSHAALRNAQTRISGVVAWASKTGPYLWTGADVDTARSALFDRPPSALARRGTGLADLVAFDGDDLGAYVPDAGFASQVGFPVVAGVAGEPGWVVGADRGVLRLSAAGPLGSSPLIGIIGTAVTPFLPPYQASGALQGNGPARVLIVTAATSVFSAEMDAALSGQVLTAPVTLKAVAPGPISSLAFPPKSAADVYLRGYAVTPNGVLRVTAQTATRWEFTPVVLPAALVPREVWFEGPRARIGFADGTVYALPSRVPIAPPLGEVVDFAQACGQQLALTLGGLSRLEPAADSTIGKWVTVPLPAGFVEKGLAGGRLHAVDDAVYVFAGAGETARVVFQGCP